MTETVLLFLATGAVAGLLAGLFGVGGGLIMVPALAFLLPAMGVDGTIVMQISIGTSLAVISATSVSSLIAHHRRGGVLWPVFMRLVPGLALGALAGAFTAHLLPGLVLKRIVGVGAVAVALQMFTGSRPRPAGALPGTGLLIGAGGIIGWASSLIGIGGGSLTVPFLSWRGIDIRKAVGTSAACGMPIAVAGALGFVASGWAMPGVPGPSLGYVSLPAFAGIAVASVMVAPLGAKLAHTLPPRRLQQAMAVLLLGIGIAMLTA